MRLSMCDWASSPCLGTAGLGTPGAFLSWPLVYFADLSSEVLGLAVSEASLGPEIP